MEQPFTRFIQAGRIHATRYVGFWGPLDTLRDLEQLVALAAQGHPPWVPTASAPVGSGFLDVTSARAAPE